MKREDILAMPAGRELDVLIAEKVMGWEVRGRYFMTPEGIRTHEETSYSGFSPSISISAAWEVVEKLSATHIYELADFGRNTYPDKTHYAWFHAIGRGGRSPNEFQARAKTLPEAICKAALIAIKEAQTHEA